MKCESIWGEEWQEFEGLRKECQNFEGDKVLFWSGQMSSYLGKLLSSSVCGELTYLIQMLNWIKTAYDDEIIRREQNED
jgi:hypothetical protein